MQHKLTKESEIRSGMTDEFYKWFAEGLARFRVRRNYIHNGEYGEH